MRRTHLFANYTHNGKNMNTLGDQIQIFTVDFLYAQMGISKDDIIYIDTNNLHTYAGEPVFLPVFLPLLNYKEHGIAGIFSDNITPVFLSLVMLKDTLSAGEVTYFKFHEPIGCRDERTYNTLVKYGICAYLGGCVTVSFPKRLHTTEQKKTFIIDPEDGIKNKIPLSIAENAIWDTHLFNKIKNPIHLAEERLKKYSDEAALVVTSLLHCSVPCMALGIPVILAKDFVSYRFGWLEALLHIYTPPEYSNIVWNPLPVDYESHKDLVKILFKKRMCGEDTSKEIALVHDFYMNRERHKYTVDMFTPIQKFIDDTWLDYKRSYEYAVWGLTQAAEMTVNYISKHYPNAKLVHIYDLQTNLSMQGISALSPDNIANYPDETVFVTAVGATESAKNLFQKINKPSHLYKISWGE